MWTAARPGKGIFRNAILFALGFMVMIFAHLTPCITVGVLMAAIMLFVGFQRRVSAGPDPDFP